MSAAPLRFQLPEPPADQRDTLARGGVACWRQDVEIPTYEPGEPDPFPMFFDHRVYQGSDGGVYPLPFIDRISTKPTSRKWHAIHLENRWVRLMLLPELGGRIHVAYDKTRNYDFFYRNNVIKPALVGLAGPWVSGGVEFNWPQHHRPATYLPVETTVEQADDGSVTVWNSDLDPLQRMRGTFGIRLLPDESTIELRVRLFNCTDETQTFLWWANAAVAVHADYQSFFPTDVHYVADHARRAITAFPAADRAYYGVDYPTLAAQRPGANEIDRYTNIPVPTSYMVTDTKDSFFGGYDYRVRAGFVHWADRNIAPGKKQWTWGNGPSGHAWDRQLTDGDGPYVELMAGAYTDNQPDFSFLAPGETREFSQFWYPIQDIGAAQQASREAALSVAVADGHTRVGIAAARSIDGQLTVECASRVLFDAPVHVAPGEPFVTTLDADGAQSRDDLVVRLLAAGREIVTWRQHDEYPGAPWVAKEPPAADEIDSVDEALITAQHLLQYRHPTRRARPYLERALAIDTGDSRAHLALATLAYDAGEYQRALGHLDAAAGRLLRRNLNPRSGELHYRRGLALERLGHLGEAVEAFAKATWDGGFAVAGHIGAARALLRLGHPADALEHADATARADMRNPTARGIRVLALLRVSSPAEAAAELASARAADPLDPFLAAIDRTLDVVDPRTYLALAEGFARLGENELARRLAQHAAQAGPTAFGNPSPIAHYVLASLAAREGDAAVANRERHLAAEVDRRLAFPAGLDDLDFIREAVVASEQAGQVDPVALGFLGVWQLGTRLTATARETFERAVAAGSEDPVVLRSAAIAVVNTGGDPAHADALLRRAIRTAGPMPRLVFERDQLSRLRHVPSIDRLAALESSGADLLDRDDLAIDYVNLLLDVGRAEEALRIMTTRVFQPFEGGEGKAIAAFERASVAVAARLAASDPAAAARMLDAGITPPESLGEGRHPAEPMAARLVAAGDAHAAAGDRSRAEERWHSAVVGGGALAVASRPACMDDYWVGVAYERLGQPDEAARVWAWLDSSADELAAAPAQPDYFATSLPDLLLFSVDDAAERRRAAEALHKAARKGRGIQAVAHNERD